MSDIPTSPPSAPPPKRRRNIVKPQSRTVGQGRVRELKCYQEVYDRIVQGWPIPEVAKFVQEVKKEATDITPTALEVSLSEFRKKLPAGVLTKGRVAPVFLKAKDQIEEGLDEIAELTRLYKLQMGRVEIDLQTEKRIKKLMPTMVQEVRMAKEILKTILDLKMDLGLSKRHLGEMQVENKIMADVALSYTQPEVKQVMENSQSRKKLIDLAERLLAARTVKSLSSPEPEIIDVEAEIPVSESYGEDE